LDTQTGGWHELGKQNLGSTQIISYFDDLTLSSLPNAIKNFLNSPQAIVGVTPDPTTNQQLLFFLNVPASYTSSGTTSTYYKMSILFNPNVVKFE
jgi:hypothetical protein